MDGKDLNFIEEQIGYRFKNKDLLQQAFVRRSYAKENGGEDNEILEFIGDKVLDVIIVKLLTEKYGYFVSECDEFDSKNDFDEFACEYNEGKLTELKKHLVERKMLASRIDMLGLADFLIMGKGDRKNNISEESSVKEDLYEAIIGAVALDSRIENQWNFEELESVIKYTLMPEEYLSNDQSANYVQLIQEWSLKEYGELPNICTTGSSYYDETGFIRSNEIRSKPKRDKDTFVINVQEYPKTHFCSRLTFQDFDKVFIGYGRSKNEARKDVCELAYNYLEENDLLHSIRDEIEDPNIDEAIGQLEILARRGYFSIPTYEFFEEHDENGNPIWRCECCIEEEDDVYYAISSSKKQAKKECAYSMLMYVLGYEEEE